MKSFLTPFLDTAKEALLNLDDALHSEAQLEGFLNDFGWEAEIEPAHLALVQSLFGINELIQNIEKLFQDIQNQVSDEAQLAQSLLNTLKDIYSLLEALAPAGQATLPTVFSEAGFWAQMRQDLPDYLIARYLQDQKPNFYAFLLFTGVIDRSFQIPTDPNRLPYTQVQVKWDKLTDFIRNPSAELSNRFGWGADKVFEHQKFLTTLAEIFGQLRLPVRLMPPPQAIAEDYYLNSDLESKDIASLTIPIIHGVTVDDSGFIEFGLRLTPIPETPADFINNLSAGPVKGIIITPAVRGNYYRAIPLSPEFALSLLGNFQSDNAIGLEIFPDIVRTVFDTAGSTVSAELRLTWEPLQPLLLLGTTDSSRIEATGFEGGVAINNTNGNSEVVVYWGTGNPDTGKKLSFIINIADADGFISKIFKRKQFRVDVAGNIQWSSSRGFGFSGAAGFEINDSVHLTLGPVEIKNYSISFRGDSSGHTQLAFGTSASLQLGPVTAIAENFGVALLLKSLKDSSDKGIFNNLDVDWRFKAPNGVGLSVETDVLKGGGYLFFDPGKGQYAGVAELNIKNKVNLKALGLLTTKKDAVTGPNFSLLLLIYGEFMPIQIGLGFTLSGVGGILGINRTADLEQLRAGVRDGSLAQLLFPTDPVRNAPQLINAVGRWFPAAEGRYVLGLMGKFGWGTPTLITLDAGLILELPAPIRIALVGVLKSLLPNEQKPIIRLQAVFLGTIDLAQGNISFDASLFDSRILEYTLFGDLAFRVQQGDRPYFLLAAGGFHPSFQPPAKAGVPQLRRLTLALANSRDFQLIFSSYLALTSNTIQIGSRVDLRVEISRTFDLDLVAFLGFDALLQLNPLWFVVDIYAGAAIRRKGRDKLALYLTVTVSGPSPWHVHGKVEFRLLGMRFRVNVDKTIGRRETTPLPPTVDLQAEVLKALRERSNWTLVPATNKEEEIVVRKRAGIAAVNPAGILEVRQQVLPFNLTIEHFGEQRPLAEAKFNIGGIQLGDTTLPAGSWSDTLDFFAPGQYRHLTEAQRLGAESFELLRNGVRLIEAEKRVGGAPVSKKVTHHLVIIRKIVPPIPVPENQAPVVVEEPQYQVFAAGQAFTFSAGRYTDPDRNDPLTYVATADGQALPAWLQFDSSTLTFSGTAPNQATALVIEITAKDAQGASVSAAFTINVYLPCYPVSPLPCDRVLVGFPFSLNFENHVADSIMDKNGVGTGFTMVANYTGTRTPEDGAPINSNLPGYEPSKLEVIGGTLKIVANKGIFATTSNNQLNALGVQIDSRQKLQLETTLVQPYNGGQFQQGGLWFGLNDKYYVKLVVTANQVELRKEVNDAIGTSATVQRITPVLSNLNQQTVRLRLIIDPSANTAEGFYSTDGVTYLNAGQTYSTKSINISGMGLTSNLAYGGVYTTYRNGPAPVTYTFADFGVSSLAAVPMMRSMATNDEAADTMMTADSMPMMAIASVGITEDDDVLPGTGLTKEEFEGLLAGSAVARAPQSFKRRQPSALQPRPVGLRLPGYVVVQRASLLPLDGDWDIRDFNEADFFTGEPIGELPKPAIFITQAEANDYLKELVAADPRLESVLQVVPDYELI